MLTLFTSSTAPTTTLRRRDRKVQAKSTLAVETLDKRQMLTTWSGAYPSTSYWSMPQTTSAYSIPSSWSMPTYNSYGSYGSYSSAYSPSSTNTYGYGTSLYGTFSSPTPANYSTSSFFNTSPYFSPSISSFGTSSFSTPTYSSYSPYGTSYGSSNVYTTRPGSSYSGTYAPSTYSSYGSSSSSSYTTSMANLQSNYNQLQRLNNQLVSMGGTPVSIPSSVTNTLNNFYGSSSSNPFSGYGGSSSGSYGGYGGSSSSYSNGTVTALRDLSALKNAPAGVYSWGGTSFRWDGKGTSGSASAVWVQPNGSVFDIGRTTIQQTAGPRGFVGTAAGRR